MSNAVQERAKTETRATSTRRPPLFAWLFILIADVGLLVWGAMAALAPQLLIGPRSQPIVPAGYEGFTNLSWQELVTSSPKTAEFTIILFRVFGAENVAFAIMAMQSLSPHFAVVNAGHGGRYSLATPSRTVCQ